jgi:hypothetical protein
MTKNQVKSFDDLQIFARERVAGSVRRNDPVAAAYWTATLSFALSRLKEGEQNDAVSLRLAAQHYAAKAASLDWEREPFEAASTYSRAKWFVIIGRNNGYVMSQKSLGMGMHWLQRATERCIPR